MQLVRDRSHHDRLTRAWIRVLGALTLTAGGLALTGATCFTNKPRERSYFVLNSKTSLDYSAHPIKGLVRVRTLHADAVYEKFQVAVRRNPYELRYDEDHIWIAKPKRMISDLIAQTLKESKRFTGVTRELGETTPDFNLSGNLHSIEVYDSEDVWFAHLSISLQLTRYGTGEALYFMTYDERRKLAQRSFSLAARALSELLSIAVEKMLKELDEVNGLEIVGDEAPLGAGDDTGGAVDGEAGRDGDELGVGRDDEREETADDSGVIMVPDKR